MSQRIAIAGIGLVTSLCMESLLQHTSTSSPAVLSKGCVRASLQRSSSTMAVGQAADATEAGESMPP